MKEQQAADPKKHIIAIFSKINIACFQNNKFQNAVAIAIPLLEKGNIQMRDLKIEILKRCVIFIQNFKDKDIPFEEVLKIGTCSLLLDRKNDGNYLYVDLALYDAIRMMTLNHVEDTDSMHILPLCYARCLFEELKNTCYSYKKLLAK